MEETKIIYHIDEEETPYLVKIPVPPDRVTLGDFKAVLQRPTHKFFFKSMDDDFGVVKEEIVEDDAHLPCFNGRVVSWLVASEGSNVSDSNSQCDPVLDVRPPVGRPLPRGLRALSKPIQEDTTETDSIISSRRGFNSHRGHRMDKYDRFGGHKPPYDPSLLSSDLETTTFLESDDDASSRITATTEHSSVSRVNRAQNRRQRRRKHRQPAMSRTSSFSSITDSSMSLNIITVTLHMGQDEDPTGSNFLGISIVGESNRGGDGGIYVGSIMKGGAVAKDGRIEPGDMILQVNDINFENMSNDEAVRVLRDVVKNPGPIKLVVAKSWEDYEKNYFTIPRTEPVRPIDPEAWVAHVHHATDYNQRPPSVTTMTSNGSDLTRAEVERTPEDPRLTPTTPMPLIVREMQKPDSGLEIRDRNWLKITIPSAFIGADIVDWLLNHVEDFTERRDARKYASMMLKSGFIRHTVNKLTFSEQCYYVFGEIAVGLAAMKIRDEPPPWTTYNSSAIQPIYAPYMGYESNAYSYPQEPSLHSGSGGSSNDTAGSRREMLQHSQAIPAGFSAPLEMRSVDSDSDSNRSKRSFQRMSDQMYRANPAASSELFVAL